MITLRVIVDDIRQGGGAGRYTEELTRALVESAPTGCEVVGLISRVRDAELRDIELRLPGLAALEVMRLPRRAIGWAWAAGASLSAVERHAAARAFSSSGPVTGMLHAASVFAPLPRHDRTDRRGDQTVVTVHDVAAWTHPETMPAASARWQRMMARRAARFADAIVVPTHATGEQLARFVDVGARVQVIGPAVSARLRLPADAAARIEHLGLPERYLLTTGSLNLSRGLGDLIEALAVTGADGTTDAGVSTNGAALPLVVTGASAADQAAIERAALEAGVDPARIIVFSLLDDADLAVVLDRATVYVAPTLDEGLGLPVLEAMSFGAPVVHADAPAIVELVADAGLAVTRAPGAGYPARLAEAIRAVLDDPALAQRMSVAAADRARAFSWRDSAEKVWQLHADL